MLKKLRKWSKRNVWLRWLVGILCLIAGLFGILLPIVQGIPFIILGLAILLPTNKFSKMLLKHETWITNGLIILSIFSAILAVLIYYNILPFGDSFLNIIQWGQDNLQKLFGG